MPFTPADVDVILAALRDGPPVEHSTCGGRYISTYAWKDGAWSIEDFEEGSIFGGIVDEATMRRRIAEAPHDAFRLVLSLRPR